MKVAPLSSVASGLLSLTFLGLACDSATTADKPAEVKPDVKVEAKPEPAAATPEAKPEPTAATPEAAPEPAAPAVTAPPVPGAPGPAYFAVEKVGIVRLDGGKFTVLADSPKA